MLFKVKKQLPFDELLVVCVKGICNLCLVPSQQMSNTAVINWHSHWQPLWRGQMLMYMEADLFSDFISDSAEQASQCEEANTGSYCRCLGCRLSLENQVGFQSSQSGTSHTC